MRVKIKFCGITSLEDALAAVEAGADLLGFNFYPLSPRYLHPLDCARIQASLQARGLAQIAVGVFVNAPIEQIKAILDDCGLDLAQLSGDEPTETLVALGPRAFKALRSKDSRALEAELHRYPRGVFPPAYLLDAHRPGQYGGTGHTADWSLASTLAQRVPILLAGGLRPENVNTALDQVRPWGVDVASGVESSPGHKDPHQMAAFAAAVRDFEKENIPC